jgi:hypothetical protein
MAFFFFFFQTSASVLGVYLHLLNQIITDGLHFSTTPQLQSRGSELCLYFALFCILTRRFTGSYGIGLGPQHFNGRASPFSLWAFGVGLHLSPY